MRGLTARQRARNTAEMKATISETVRPTRLGNEPIIVVREPFSLPIIWEGSGMKGSLCNGFSSDLNEPGPFERRVWISLLRLGIMNRITSAPTAAMIVARSMTTDSQAGVPCSSRASTTVLKTSATSIATAITFETGRSW